MQHSYTVEDRTYTACIECDRGVNGTAENKCSSGGGVTDSRQGCLLGTPMGTPGARYSWAVTGDHENQIVIRYTDLIAKRLDSVTLFLPSEKDAADAALKFRKDQTGPCPYYDFWHMKPKPVRFTPYTPKPQKMMSTGVTVWQSNNKWWASLDMSNFKRCQPGCVEGNIATRYGHESLSHQITVIIDNAKMLGIEFWNEAGVSPSVMYKNDGENFDYPAPDGWRKIVNAETDRLGWCGYKYDKELDNE